MSACIVFAGPSITPDEVRSRVDAIVLGPAAQGDVYRAARSRPTAIGLIDGYFERIPAVWHKEILWAIEHGVPVVAGGSMGALRAAELHQFGVLGVGWIFEAFRDGVLTDDDEVAVAHASAEDGYRPLSEAMVNIRRTIDRAVEEEVVDDAAGRRVVEAAKQLFYPQRTWAELLAGESDADRSLRGWLAEGRVDQKHHDAIAVCDAVGQIASGVRQPPQSHHRTEHTTWWDQLVQQSTAGDPTHDAPTLDDLLDELRVTQRFQHAWGAALLQILSDGWAKRSGWSISQQLVDTEFSSLMTGHGIRDRAAFETWMQSVGVQEHELVRAVTGQAALRMTSARLSHLVVGAIPDQLRMAGSYASTIDKVRRKRALLEGAGVDNPSLSDAGFPDHAALWAWWFDRWGTEEPADIDWWAKEHGWRDADALRRSALRERCAERLAP